MRHVVVQVVQVLLVALTFVLCCFVSAVHSFLHAGVCVSACCLQGSTKRICMLRCPLVLLW